MHRKGKRPPRDINEKWNPVIFHPPPPGDLSHPKPKEVGSKHNEATNETVLTLNPHRIESTLKDCIRVFTKTIPPPASKSQRAPRTGNTNNSPITIYTDGSCTNNGETSARAGSGIWFADNDPRNQSLRVPTTLQSNQTGELYAILLAISSLPPDQAIVIRTDSMYAINGLTKNLEKWEDQGWLFSKHATLFKNITAWMRFQSNKTQMVWVKGHSGIKGNEEADKLAAEGSKINIPIVDTLPAAPENMVPSGAKLSALSQKDFYRAIKKANPPPTQKKSANTIGRIQACTEEAYNTAPTISSTWKSAKHKDLTKKTQEFMWKCFHETFKIGRFWENINKYEHRGTCTHCGTEELMEHILTKCNAPSRTQIWSLANELWSKRSRILIPSNYSALLGCCLTDFKKENDKSDKGLNRLFRIIISESMYMIWKITCKRMISWSDDPTKYTTNGSKP